VVIAQGDVWWVDLPEPVGAEPGFRRPVVVVQSDSISRSGLASVVVVSLTGNLGWADSAGCTALSAAATGLPKDSVAQAFQIYALDRSRFTAKAGRLTPGALDAVFDALDAVLGR
jgi:mRNA interferase MazF